jgi:hypothetical protein
VPVATAGAAAAPKLPKVLPPAAPPKAPPVLAGAPKGLLDVLAPKGVAPNPEGAGAALPNRPPEELPKPTLAEAPNGAGADLGAKALAPPEPKGAGAGAPKLPPKPPPVEPNGAALPPPKPVFAAVPNAAAGAGDPNRPPVAAGAAVALPNCKEETEMACR